MCATLEDPRALAAFPRCGIPEIGEGASAASGGVYAALRLRYGSPTYVNSRRRGEGRRAEALPQNVEVG